MRINAAITICKNINSPILARDNKLTAIETILNSQQGSFHLPKNYLFDVIGWLKNEYDKFKLQEIEEKGS